MYFARYSQLESRTMMTLRGSRWNSGLIDMVSDKFVLGMRMVVVHAFGSHRPIVWNPIISEVSISAAMMMKRIRDANPFGVVHLMIRRRGRVSVVVKWCFSPVVFDVCCLMVFGLFGKRFGYLSQLDDYLTVGLVVCV